MRAAHVPQGHIALPRDRNDLWIDWHGDPRLQKPPSEGWRAPDSSLKEEPIRAHEELFTSGDYVHEFQPEARHNPFARDYARKRDAVIRAVAGTDQRVLDVGGGMGRMSVPLSRRHFVTLTDISSQMLELARPQASERLRLQVADARALPFEDGQFDYVLCIDVLPHIPQPQQLLEEVGRMLKPGGTLVIDITNSWPLWTLAYPSYMGRRPRRWLHRTADTRPGVRHASAASRSTRSPGTC